MNFRLKLFCSMALSTALLATPAISLAQIPSSLISQGTVSLAPMLEKATPAVVSIAVSGSKKVQQQQIPDALRYFFGQRGGRQQPQEQPFQGLGSGVIIDADDGYIVTNYHVIDEADKIKITLKDGREFEATKVGGDKKSDIALLKISAQNLIEMPLADSDKLRVGDFTVAIGNPFGLTQTVTSGIISALGRAGLNIEGYEDFIQTDAAINSGNSGGALINLKGELIGINTAIYAPGGGNVGIAFSIPANMMKSLVNQILDFGEVRRGLLGIVGSAVNAELAESMGLSVAQGAFIQKVVEDSAAAEADLKAGDVIVSLNGVKLKTFNELASKVATIGAGKKISLGIIRDNELLSVDVTLKADIASNLNAEALMPELSGALLSDLEPGDDRQGVIVNQVEERSPAARSGLETNDIIYGVNRKPVKDIKSLRALLKNARGVIALRVLRGRTSMYLLLR